MVSKKIELNITDPLVLLGSHDQFLRLVEKSFDTTIVVRDNAIHLSGTSEDVAHVEQVFLEMISLLNRNGRLSNEEVKTIVDLVTIENGNAGNNKNVSWLSKPVYMGKKGEIRAKTLGQQAYVDAVLSNDIVFAIGPAGTGKTYLAVAMALSALRNGEVSRIILTRPAIEAGENLGFLPGDLMDKVDPYLRPLTDALFSMLPPDQLQKFVEQKIIEIVPLAYMRGRTLGNAFVILDEAQNTSPMQMKMFLTRLGANSRTIITGDITQVDLPESIVSGLVQIQDVLKHVDGVGFVYLEKKDVVRHRLVKEIIQAYENYNGNSVEKGSS